MSLDSYKAALESARNELGQLARQREQLDRRLMQLTKIIESLIPLIESETATEEDSSTFNIASGAAGESPSPFFDQEATITEATKKVFDVFGRGSNGADVALTPLDVRGALNVAGWDLSQHKNAMATIHSVLKRLVEQDWLELTEKEGKPGYIRARGKYLREFKELTAEFNDSTRTWAEAMRHQTEESSAQIGEALSRIAQQVREANIPQIGEALSVVARQVNEVNTKLGTSFAEIAQEVSKPLVLDPFIGQGALVPQGRYVHQRRKREQRRKEK